jgi:GT2 family glycosyltransferase
VQGVVSLARRVIEIVRFEGVRGLVARTRAYLGRRVRGVVAADFSELARTRRVFTGRLGGHDDQPERPGRFRSTGLPSCAPGHDAAGRAQTVDIVVCVHNALEDVNACLESVAKYDDGRCRLIIVDDGSAAPTRDFLRHYASGKDIQLIRNEQAGGYTIAANQGMKAATGDFVILLNSDTIVTRGWVDNLVVCANSRPSLGLVGPLSNTASWQSIPDIERKADWASNNLPDGISVSTMGEVVTAFAGCLYPRISFLNGFCLLIKREVIERVGYFDEQTFAKGYGEENDYCLRARANGYELAVADNVYIYHSQSKSYGDARRQELARRAGHALAGKHGPAVIEQGVQQCRYDRVLTGIRARARYLLERRELLDTAPVEWKGRRILFVLPVSEAGGGANVVIAEAKAMRRLGVQVELLNLARFRPAFEASYGDLEIPVTYVSSPDKLIAMAGGYDVVVATANYTVQWLRPLEHAPGVTLAYYIQDFEPRFYDESDPHYQVALRSYTSIPRMQLFTKTEWNAREVQHHTGRMPVAVGPSVDVDQFRPRTQYVVDANAKVRIAAMLRPSSPRRNASGTVHVLLKLQKRFGRALEIVTFGSESHGPPLPDESVGLDFRDFGHLSPDRTAALLETADIFLDMSSYQAMGLTAMEAMACGAVAVVPRSGGATSFATHDRNALVMDTTDLGAVVEAVSGLVADYERRRSLQEAAVKDVNQFYPERAAWNILSYLLPSE